MKRTAASIYGGIGGGLLGLHWAGFKTTYLYEPRDFVSKRWFDWSWERFYDRPEFVGFIDVQRADVIVGSPPCKRFSPLAVRKKDRHEFTPDELEFWQFLKLMQELRPEAFILENLSSITDFVRFNEEEQIWTCGEAVLQLKRFRIRQYKLNAMHFNVPQSRRRLFWIGLPIDAYKDYEPPDKGRRVYTVWDAFNGVEGKENHEKPKHSEERVAGFARLKPGESYYGTQNNRRILWSEPGPTITSHRTQYVHPEEPRTLTVRECARIMGFPDTFIFHGPKTKQHDQVGCGICPPITAQIGSFIKKILG